MSESKNNELGPGVVTLLQWTMMPDGCTYMQLFAKRWVIVTNEASGIQGLRTTDRFHVVAYDSAGVAQVVIPGCQAKGYARCDENPSLKGGPQAYSIKE